MTPADGASNPASMFRMVDFPAPLGPSRPVTPRPMPKETSETATTSPYHLATLRSVMMASSPGGKPGSGSDTSCTCRSVMALIPEEHHQRADHHDCHHHPGSLGERHREGIDIAVSQREQPIHHRSDRTRRAENEGPTLDLWLIAQRVPERQGE